MARREYDIPEITVNGRKVSRVVIDEHVDKHSDIDDQLILALVNKLDGERLTPDDVAEGFEYFGTLIEYGEKQYRLVWLLEDDEIYVGVITVYRDDRRKK